MHVVKREFMYVSKPFGGDGGGGVAKVDKIRIGCLTPAFMPSRGPTSGRKCYVTPAFLMIPNKGDKIKTQKKTKTKFFPWCL